MVLEYFRASFSNFFLKKNLAVARIKRRGGTIQNHVFDLSKATNDLGKGETATKYISPKAEEIIYRERAAFGFVPVIYYLEGQAEPTGINKSGDLSAETLKSVYQNDQSILRAQFWAQASWLLGNPAKIGGFLLLLAAFAAAYFAFTSAGNTQQILEILNAQAANAAATVAENADKLPTV